MLKIGIKTNFGIKYIVYYFGNFVLSGFRL